MSKRRREGSPSTSAESSDRPQKKLSFPSHFPNAIDVGMSNYATSEASLTNSLNTATGETKHSIQMNTTNIYAGHCQWSVSAEYDKEEAIPNKFHLRINTVAATKWSVRADIEINLRNPNFERKVTLKLTDRDFDGLNGSASLDIDPVSIGLLATPLSGQLKIDRIEVEIKISVTKSSGFRSYNDVTYDLGAQNADCDLKIEFENGDEPIYINIGYLAALSSYFSALRQDFSNLPTDPSCGLPVQSLDVERDDFNKLILHLYPSKRGIQDDEIPALLALANRFLLDSVINAIEDRLIDSDTSLFDNFMKLEWSFNYNLVKLKEVILSRLNSKTELDKYSLSPMYRRLSEDVVNFLFELSLPIKCDCNTNATNTTHRRAGGSFLIPPEYHIDPPVRHRQRSPPLRPRPANRRLLQASPDHRCAQPGSSVASTTSIGTPFGVAATSTTGEQEDCTPRFTLKEDEPELGKGITKTSFTTIKFIFRS